MSGLLIVLLSGLTIFGVSLIDNGEVTQEATDDVDAAPEALVESGSSPLSEALQDPPTDTTPDMDDPENETATDTDTGAGSGTDTGTDTDIGTDTGTGTDTVTATTSEADTITGSQQDDTIDAGAGDDIVNGRLGDDTIAGGIGADVVSGDAGNDILYGGVVGGLDDTAADTLFGGEGDDQIHLGDDDSATGGEGADTFIRLNTLSTRALVADFDASEDVIVIEHESDTPPTIDSQTIATDGVILQLSDGTRLEFSGLTEAIDTSLISFVDTRVT